MKFFVLLMIMEYPRARSCNKKSKLHFRKSKLGIQSLSYVGPSTWNKLSNNLKTITSLNFFQGYLRYKTIFCHKVALDVLLMNFFI